MEIEIESKPPNVGRHHGGGLVPHLDVVTAWYADDALGFAMESRFAMSDCSAQMAMSIRDGVKMELFEAVVAKQLPVSLRKPQSDRFTHGNKYAAFAVSDFAALLIYADNRSADHEMEVREAFGKGCFLSDDAANLVEIVKPSVRKGARL